jgi:hypothetical protein
MIAAVAILLMMAYAAINPFNIHEGVLSMAATGGNVCLAEDAKAEYCECAEAFTELVSTEDPSRFYAAVVDLYRVLSTYRSVNLRDQSIKDAIDRAFKSWGGSQDGQFVFDYKDIDYQYYSVVELIGFDAWRKVELNVGEQVNALVPGEIRHSSVKDAYPAIFEFEIYDTSTLWAERCKVYARFCKLMARRVCTEDEQTGEVKTLTSTDAIQQSNAPKTKGGKVNDDSLPPVADAKLIECFQVFQNCANNHRGKYKTTEADWAAIALYVIPQKDRKYVDRKEIISTLSKGASEIGKITNYPEDRFGSFIKNSQRWHREEVSCNLDYYEFMRKFLAWKDSSKVTGKVTGQ